MLTGEVEDRTHNAWITSQVCYHWTTDLLPSSTIQKRDIIYVRGECKRIPSDYFIAQTTFPHILLECRLLPLDWMKKKNIDFLYIFYFYINFDIYLWLD